MNRTSGKMWSGVVPDVLELKIFESPVMVKIPAQKKKLSEKSNKMIFVGYDSQKKGCYGGVIFHE